MENKGCYVIKLSLFITSNYFTYVEMLSPTLTIFFLYNTGTPCEDLDTTLTDIDVQVLYGSGTDYNSVVRLSCSPYTEVIGAATVSCQNGSWSYTEDVSPSFCRGKLAFSL